MREYVESRERGFYIKGTRISLDSVVCLFNDGASPESVFQAFPAVGSLENVYGAITWRAAKYEADRQAQELPENIRERMNLVREKQNTGIS